MVDKQKVEQAIRLLLEGIGEDTEREGLKDTPDRIARMCMESTVVWMRKQISTSPNNLK